MTLTVSPQKRLMATACKATTAEHAVVRVYDTIKYHLVGQPLGGHSLTVTRIAFSPDERFILSVSRDRSWRLYTAQESGGKCFELLAQYNIVYWPVGKLSYLLLLTSLMGELFGIAPGLLKVTFLQQPLEIKLQVNIFYNLSNFTNIFR